MKNHQKNPPLTCEQRKDETYSSFGAALDLEKEVIPDSHQMKLNDVA